MSLAAQIAAGYPYLVVDLGDTEFVDSAGLGSLIGGMRAARQHNGDLRVANPTDQATMLFSLTSLGFSEFSRPSSRLSWTRSDPARVPVFRVAVLAR